MPDIKNIIKYWRSLSNNHQDKEKFGNEQARIRMKAHNQESYLKDLEDPDWELNYIKEYEETRTPISKTNLNNNSLDPR